MTKLAKTQVTRNQGHRFDLDELRETLCRTWYGTKNETYEIKFTTQTKATCTRYDSGKKSFNMWIDDDRRYLWWGTNCAYWSDLADLLADKGKVSWYSGTEWEKVAKPRFVWRLSDELEVKSAKPSKGNIHQDEQWHRSDIQADRLAPKEVALQATQTGSVMHKKPSLQWKQVAPQELPVDSAKHSHRPALDPSDFPPGLAVPPHLKHAQEIPESPLVVSAGLIASPPGLEALAALPALTSGSKRHEQEEGDTTASSDCSDSDKEARTRLRSADFCHSFTSDDELCYGPSESPQVLGGAKENRRPPEVSEMPMTKLAFMSTAQSFGRRTSCSLPLQFQ